MTDQAYNFAYLDEQTKRMIRRAILKGIAVPGYQVPFASREMPMPYGWGTGGVQVTAACLTPNDCLKVGSMIIGGANIIMYYDAKAGKEYQVWESNSPGGPPPGEAGSQWVAKAGVSKVATSDGQDSLVFPKPPTTDRKFYRIESKDHDTDNDGGQRQDQQRPGR